MKLAAATPLAWAATLATLFVLAMTSTALAIDTTWTFDGDGFWDEAANWDNGVPLDDTFDVFIDDGDTAVNVTLRGFGSVRSLALGTDDTLTVHADLGQFPTAGLTSAQGFTNDGTIVLSGTFSLNHFSQGQLVVTDGILVNGSTGVLDFSMFGLFIQQTIDAHFTNYGTVVVRGAGAGRLLKTGGGGVYANHGEFTVGSSFGFTIDSGTFTQADGALDVTSQFYVNPGSTLNLTGGEMNLSGELRIDAISDVNLLTGGVLNMTGNGIVYNSGTFTQDGGTLNYTSWFFSEGTYRFLGGTITGVPLLTHNATLEIGPMATDPVSFLFNTESEFVGEVHAGQVLTVQTESAENASLTSAEGFVNNGEIRLTSTSTGTGVTTLTVADGALDNGPTGVLHFQTGGTGGRIFTGDLVNDGTVIVDRLTHFDKTGGSYTNDNQFTINSELTVDNGGVLTNSATGVISGGGTLNGPLENAGTVRAMGSTFNLVGGPATNAGVFEAIDQSTLNVTAPLSNLNAGTLAGGTYRSVSPTGAAVLTVAGSAVTTLAADTTVELSGDGATLMFDNTALESSLASSAGTLNVFDGHHFIMANALANSGTVHLGGDGLAAATLTTSVLTNSGMLTGSGTLIAEVNNASGTVAPGNSPGQLTVDGDYTQGATGSLAIELSSLTSFDVLAVTGTATLDGVLVVSLLDGFMPAPDDAFVVLTAAGVSGTFDGPVLPPLTGDLAWKVLYETGSVSLIAHLPGDYNGDAVVDAADYTVWRDQLGQPVARGDGADGDFNGAITAADHGVWKAHFGGTASGGAGAEVDATAAIPEPAGGILWVLALLGATVSRRRAPFLGLARGHPISDT